MRVRKIINLYSDEPTHVELLEYLDAIEGDSRRHQALVQMALIGFRVVARHESGDEAFFRMRNPDASALIGHQQPRMTRGLEPIERKPAIPRRRPSTDQEAPVLIEADVQRPVSAQAQKVPQQIAQTTRNNEERGHTYSRQAPTIEPFHQQEDQELEEQQEEIIEVQDPMALLRQIDDES